MQVYARPIGPPLRLRAAEREAAAVGTTLQIFGSIDVGCRTHPTRRPGGLAARAAASAAADSTTYPQPSRTPAANHQQQRPARRRGGVFVAPVSRACVTRPGPEAIEGDKL